MHSIALSSRYCGSGVRETWQSCGKHLLQYTSVCNSDQNEKTKQNAVYFGDMKDVVEIIGTEKWAMRCFHYFYCSTLEEGKAGNKCLRIVTWRQVCEPGGKNSLLIHLCYRNIVLNGQDLGFKGSIKGPALLDVINSVGCQRIKSQVLKSMARCIQDMSIGAERQHIQLSCQTALNHASQKPRGAWE